MGMQGHMFGDVGREERVKISEAVRLKRVFIVIVIYYYYYSYYSRLPITRTFKGNRKRFELSGV